MWPPYWWSAPCWPHLCWPGACSARVHLFCCSLKRAIAAAVAAAAAADTAVVRQLQLVLLMREQQRWLRMTRMWLRVSRRLKCYPTQSLLLVWPARAASSVCGSFVVAW